MKKVILLILDGLGLAKAGQYNAVALANTKNLDYLFANHPNAKLTCHGRAVGLPNDQMGNSEVGHMTTGSGRVIKQEFVKITDVIESNELGELTAIKDLHRTMQSKKQSKLHIIGLVSDGGVHSHIDHIVGLCKHFANYEPCLHVITDGRDVSPKSAMQYINVLQEHNIPISSIAGRFYAMDRDKRWQRTKEYYDTLLAKTHHFTDPHDYIKQQYDAGISDEFIQPAYALGFTGIAKDDVVLIANFRADRVRQISVALTDPNFTEFARPFHDIGLYTMTFYGKELEHLSTVVFNADQPSNTLGEIVAKAGLKQLRIAETEKYPHVTYFFNAGKEEPFDKEDRMVVPSPKVETYDLQPEMSLPDLMAKLQTALKNDYSLIVCNFANCDMVGHSGNVKATIAAVEAVDNAIGMLMQEANVHGYDMLITADHGNAECMFDESANQPLTSHTCNPVPIIYYQHNIKDSVTMIKDGELKDIAPTLLHLLNLDIPRKNAMQIENMTGECLIYKDE